MNELLLIRIRMNIIVSFSDVIESSCIYAFPFVPTQYDFHSKPKPGKCPFPPNLKLTPNSKPSSTNNYQLKAPKQAKRVQGQEMDDSHPPEVLPGEQQPPTNPFSHFQLHDLDR